MNKQEFKELKEDINSYVKENNEAIFQMYIEYMSLIIKILSNKGFDTLFISEIKKIKDEYINILKEEKFLFKQILKKWHTKDIDAVDNLICKINEKNEQTITYYYSLLDDFTEAVENNYKSYKRNPRFFNTVIETSEFRNELIGLNININIIKNILNYEDDFWNYIEDKTLYIQNPFDCCEEKKDFYGFYYELLENKIIRFTIIVPQIVDLETALINTREFKKAYMIYSYAKANKINFENNLEKTKKFK